MIAPNGVSALFVRPYGETGLEVLIPPGAGWDGFEPAWTWTTCKWHPRDLLGQQPPDPPGPRAISVLDALRRAREWSKGARRREAARWVLEETALYIEQLLDANQEERPAAIDHGLDLLSEMRGVAHPSRVSKELLDEALEHVPELAAQITGLTHAAN